jgi:WD40 repeat protein
MNQDSSKFATGRYDEGTLTIFNTSTAEEIITWKAHSSSVRGVIFCPDNQTIISGGEDKLIHFWNINTGEKIHTLAEHPYPVNSLSLSADGGTLVSTRVTQD